MGRLGKPPMAGCGQALSHGRQTFRLGRIHREGQGQFIGGQGLTTSELCLQDLDTRFGGVRTLLRPAAHPFA